MTDLTTYMATRISNYAPGRTDGGAATLQAIRRRDYNALDPHATLVIVDQAITYLREFALEQQDDAYGLALVANALAAYDPDHGITKAVLDRLYEMRVEEGDVVYWMTAAPSFMGATGDSGSLEATALAAIALMRADAHPDAVGGALAYLVQGKDSWGTWQTTQATILSLKALLLSTEKGGEAEGSATILVSLNGEQTQEIAIDETNADVMHLVTFDRGFSPSGANRVQIELQGPESLGTIHQSQDSPFPGDPTELLGRKAHP